MIAWFVRNPVAANLLMTSIVIAGLYSVIRLIPLEIFPSNKVEEVIVSVSLRGATPEDVEQGVTIRIEEAVQNLAGIDRIVSNSWENLAQVKLEVEKGYDPRDLLADVKTRVDAINTFPVNAERPVISFDADYREVLVVTIASDHGEKETRAMGEQVREDLLQMDNISQAALNGVRNYEIAIEISQQTLRQYNLDFDQVANAIGAGSIDVSSGNLYTDRGDILLRAKGQAYHKDEFAPLAIKTNPDGSILRLSDIATIRDGFEETTVWSQFNGRNAVFVEVYRLGKHSAIDVADTVKAYIEEKKTQLPQGYEISYWDDDSRHVKERLSILGRNAAQGALLVLILLSLFLRPAIAFWVFLGVPVAFLGSMMMMPMLGVTMNSWSLFGFLVVLGIVVDDAIVTGENIYSHLRNAESGQMAAIKGAQEVATPVTFGILTTIVAFLPLAFMEGRRSDMVTQIPYVVIPVLLFSLVESKFVLPAHLSRLKLSSDNAPGSAAKTGGWLASLSAFQQRFATGFERATLHFYQPLLVRVLSHKALAVSVFVGMLMVVLALIFSGWTSFTFFPKVPSETLRMSLTMPAGTSFDVTNRYILQATQQAEKLRDKYIEPGSGNSVIRNILSTTGEWGNAHHGRVEIEIITPEKRKNKITAPELTSEWRQLVGKVPGAELLTFRDSYGGSSSPVEIELSANSLATLERAAADVRQHLTEYPTVFDINDSLSDGKDELRIELTDQGRALGLTRAAVSQQVRQAFYGTEVQRIQRGRDDVRVMVRLPLSERQNAATLQTLLLSTPAGDKVPLSHVAELIPDQSPSAIRRIDRYRTVSVTADVEKEQTNMTRLQQEIDSYLQSLVSRYPGLNAGMEGEAREQRESFQSLGVGLILMLFTIYVLLAIPLKSYLQPLVIMSVIPFGCMGAVVGHWLMGMPLTLMSLLGLLALVGVVINDSLVLVDYINRKYQESGDLQTAVLSAGVARFRPVMLTSFTTFVGLMPLLFEENISAQFMIPMAVSLGFGIIFATVVTLFLVPVNYLLAVQLKAFFTKGERLQEYQN